MHQEPYDAALALSFHPFHLPHFPFLPIIFILFLVHCISLLFSSPPHPTGVKGMTSPPYMGAGCQMEQPRALPHLPLSSSLLSGWVRTAWCTGMCTCLTYLLVISCVHMFVCFLFFIFFMSVCEYSSKSVLSDIKHAIIFPLTPK